MFYYNKYECYFYLQTFKLRNSYGINIKQYDPSGSIKVLYHSRYILRTKINLCDLLILSKLNCCEYVHVIYIDNQLSIESLARHSFKKFQNRLHEKFPISDTFLSPVCGNDPNLKTNGTPSIFLHCLNHKVILHMTALFFYKFFNYQYIINN